MPGIGDSLCLHGLSFSTDGEDSVNILAIPSPPSRFEPGIVGLEGVALGAIARKEIRSISATDASIG